MIVSAAVGACPRGSRGSSRAPLQWRAGSFCSSTLFLPPLVPCSPRIPTPNCTSLIGSGGRPRPTCSGLMSSVGTFAGYRGGRTDEILMRTMDALMSFPSLLLAMLILTMVGPATGNIIIGIAAVFTPRVARVVRSVVLGLRSLAYVEAARLRGDSSLAIMVREILPNALGPIIVEGAMRMSYAIVLGASLGFLGLGVQPPEADWGLMISEARDFILIAPWMVLFPAAAISLLVIAANLFADGLGHLLAVDGAAGGRASV